MQTQLFKQSSASENLIIYFAGWATSIDLIKSWPLPDNYDLLCCWDYRDLTFSVDVSHYQHIHLVAWSMGVWAAEQSLPLLAFKHAIAINGTPLAIDDLNGIPHKIFEGTLNNLTPISLQKFTKRMCGTEALLCEYNKVDAIDFMDAHQELTAIYRYFPQSRTPQIAWTKAIIGNQDHIFPTKNQKHYWDHCHLQKKVKIEPLAAPHFLFPYFKDWSSLWT